MQEKVKRKARLARQDWLDAALTALLEGGIAGVTMERLAAGLGVTRGSFYYHFRDRAELLDELLDYWVSNWTVAVRDDVAALGLDPRSALLALMRVITHRKAAEHDVAFRAWALHDDRARKVLTRVDAMRVEYMTSIFLAMGFEGLEAENRALLALYYETAQPAMFNSPTEEQKDLLLVERHRFLTAGADA
jgi:AcrR family transcriptional regulator